MGGLRLGIWMGVAPSQRLCARAASCSLTRQAQLARRVALLQHGWHASAATLSKSGLAAALAALGATKVPQLVAASRAAADALLKVRRNGRRDGP